MKRTLLFFISLVGITSSTFGQTTAPHLVVLPIDPPREINQSLFLGRVPAFEKLHLSISLPYNHPDELEQFVASVSNPKSPDYRHFIRPEEVGQRFGLSLENVRKVESYLVSKGISVRMIAKNRLSILADATVGQAEAAFGTEIDEFQAFSGYKPQSGRLFSFVSPPVLPSDIARFVNHIGGMESFTHAVPRYEIPDQLRVLYNLAPLYSGGNQGQGRTVAISNFDGFRLSNVPFEYTQFGLPVPAGGVGTNITVKTINGGAASGNPQGEGDLDIQSVLAVAPLSNVVVYDGGGFDLIGVLTQEANDNLADFISESWGWSLSASTTTAAHNLHLSMSAQGITYMAASGDHGTTISPYFYPDIEPEVLLVGGTTVTTNTAGNRTTETGWSGSGGGWQPTSDTFNVKPSYQVGTGVPTGINYRLSPDISLDADPNSGYVVHFFNSTNGAGFYIFGGTSAASPTVAGSLADCSQQLIASGFLPADANGKHRFGRIQDLLYSFNGDSSVFFDVTSGSNGTLPNSTVSSAGPGWDFVTGWGAFNFQGFVNRLSANSLSSLSIAPTTVVGGATTTVTGTITLASAAPAAGLTITLTGGDSAIGHPATVLVAASHTTATFNITTSAVSTAHTETLTATYGSTTRTATLTVTATPVSSFTFSPTGVSGGVSSIGKVTLAGVAGTGGAVVALTGGDAAVSYPSTVTVSAGALFGTFTVTTTPVSAATIENITATFGGSTKVAKLTVNPPLLSSFTTSPTSQFGGYSVTGTVKLGSAAGPTGLTISLSGGDASVSYPASVTIPSGSILATFTINSSAVTVNHLEALKASQNSLSKLTNLTIMAPPTVSTLTFLPTSVVGGSSTTGVVTLSGKATPAGAVISLAGGDGSVTYPATVTINPGSTSAAFTVKSAAVSSAKVETLTATLGASAANGSFTINLPPVLSFTLSKTAVTGGTSVTGTVKLNSQAGPSGDVVTLSGGDASVGYPATITIAAGATSATFTITTTSVAVTTTETLSASLGSSTKSVGLTLNP